MSDWWILGPEPWSRADWLSLGQLIFTFGGFFLAIQQLKRTAVASEETSKKITALQSRQLANDLLVELPKLHKIDDEIDAALKRGDQVGVERGLTDYARAASAAVAMLESDSDDGEANLVNLLVQAGRAATKAKSDLAKGGADLDKVVWRAATKISAASVEASAVTAKRRRRIEEDD